MNSLKRKVKNGKDKGDGFLCLINRMARDYGVSIEINWGYREYDEQDRLHKENPSKAAAPTTRWHEYGGAVDINMNSAFGALGLSDTIYASYGLVRAALNLGETWHFQLIDTGSSSITDSIEGKKYANSIITWGSL